MKTRKVIRNTPTKLPIIATLVTYLCLEKWSAPEWLWGVLGAIFVIIWIIAIVDIWNCERIDIFETKDEPPVKKTFKDRIEEKAKQNC